MTIDVTLNETELEQCLRETKDPSRAVDEYAAEYKRRIERDYPDAEVTVELGAKDSVYVEPWDDWAVSYIKETANELVNDWSWLTQ